MSFKPRNQFWMQRKRHGSPRIFKDAEALWQASSAYFQWVDDNPLTAVELMKYQGEVSEIEVPLMRPMTLTGLCVFLGISYTSWQSWRRRDEGFAITVRQIEAIIYEHKFTGAAANLFNASIIARDLGLTESRMAERKIEVPVSAPAGPVPTITDEMSAQEAADAYARTLFADHDPRF